MITNIGYKKVNRLSFRKRYEIDYFHNLKNIKNSFKDEKKSESWVFDVGLRYKLSLVIKYFFGYFSK